MILAILGGITYYYGYIEYLEQDRKILEQTKDQLNAHEAKLRAIQGKSIQQSDIANKPGSNNGNNKNNNNDGNGEQPKNNKPKNNIKNE